MYVKKGYQPGPQEQLWRPPKADGSELLRRPASELFPKPPTTQAEFRALGKEAVQEALDPANEMDAYDAIDHILSTLYPDGPNVTWRYKYPEGYRIPEVLPLPLELVRKRARARASPRRRLASHASRRAAAAPQPATEASHVAGDEDERAEAAGEAALTRPLAHQAGAWPAAALRAPRR